MTPQPATIAIFDTHLQAEQAVKNLDHNGVDLKKLSIVGKDIHTDEHVVGYYNAGDRMKYWGKEGAFWGGIWGLLFGAAFFWVPGVGPLVLAGPLVAVLLGVVEGAFVVGGFSALGAAFYSMGIPKDSVLDYETAVKNGRFIVICHGTHEEVIQAHHILEEADAAHTALHAALHESDSAAAI